MRASPTVEAMSAPAGYAFGPFLLVPATRELLRQGETVPLPPKAFDALLLLVEHRDRVVSKAELRAHLWRDVAVGDSSVTQEIFVLRQALEDEGQGERYVVTVPRHGYRFVASVEETAGPGVASEPLVPGARRFRLFYAAGLLAAALLGVLATLWFAGGGTQPTGPAHHLTLDLPSEAPLASIAAMPGAFDYPAITLSRDGRHLAYVAETAGGLQLYLHDMTQGTTRPLAGTQGGHTPFFSPTGEWLAFVSGNLLLKMRLSGGPPVPLTEVSEAMGAVWGTDDVIYFNSRHQLFHISANGGPVEPEHSAPGASMPEPLAPGRGVLANIDKLRSSIGWFDEQHLRRSLFTGFSVKHRIAGYVLYGLSGRLLAARLDERRVNLRGSPIALASDMRTAPYGVAQFAVSEEGTIVYVPGRDLAVATFVRVDREGRATPLGLPNAPYGPFSVAPDGERLAAQLDSGTGNGSTDIWVYDLRRGTSFNLTGRDTMSEPRRNLSPRWTVDARDIIYLRIDGSRADLLRRRADPDVLPTTLWSSSRDGTGLRGLYPMGLSPDGKILAAFGSVAPIDHDLQTQDLYTVALEDRSAGDRPSRVRPFLATGSQEVYGQFSRDGQYMVFLSDSSGQNEVYVIRYPSAQSRCQVSRGGAMDPSWSLDGREVLYKVGTALYSVSVDSVERCAVGDPRRLFDGLYPDRWGFGRDTLPGGDFIMLQSPDARAPVPRLHVITNVLDELRRVAAR